MKNKIKEDRYHHGDLRYALIEKGIEIINLEGESNFSLRKVATRCGVSNAAPYAHFKNKEELLDAMRLHVIDQLAEELEKAKKEYYGTPDVLMKMGKSYVLFFYKYPVYHNFLFSKKNLKMDFSLEFTEKTENKALEILKKTALDIFDELKVSSKIIQDKIIAMWALVEGLTVIITMSDIKYDENWDKRIEEILNSVMIFDGNENLLEKVQ
jgi:Transcriptional regulator